MDAPGHRSERRGRAEPAAASIERRLPERVAAALGELVRGPAAVAVGLSGGVDSVVLLDVAAQLAPRLNLALRAVHVNHRISANAAAWADFCRALAERYRIPLEIVEVHVERDAGTGLEAAARAARYAVFEGQPVAAVLLAHNSDDQAETLLLQLLRGAGPRGLAALPGARPLGERGPRLVRPLLGVPRSEILAYAKQRGLEWIEDESNASLDFDRNFLRHEVLPQIARRFPAYRETWGRAAAHFAETSDMLDALAEQDAAGVVRPDRLLAAPLIALGPARARNLLRWWLRQRGAAAPARSRMDAALRQLLGAQRSAQPVAVLGGVKLRRHRDAIVADEAGGSVGTPPWSIAWSGEPRLQLPGASGALIMQNARGRGIRAALLRDAEVTVRSRIGGERIKLDPRRPTRTLKNLLREANVPAWEREHAPLIFCGDQLAWAGHLGADCRYAAKDEEQAVLPLWLPHDDSVA